MYCADDIVNTGAFFNSVTHYEAFFRPFYLLSPPATLQKRLTTCLILTHSATIFVFAGAHVSHTHVHTSHMHVPTHVYARSHTYAHALTRAHTHTSSVTSASIIKFLWDPGEFRSCRGAQEVSKFTQSSLVAPLRNFLTSPDTAIDAKRSFSSSVERSKA